MAKKGIFGKFGKSKGNLPNNFRKSLDYDTDGVANFIDCKPKNRKKHSILIPFASGFIGSYVGTAIYSRFKKRRR